MSTVEQIAKVCHEVNRAYCASIGDNSQKPWDEAEEWQRQSAVKGVQFAIDNPDATPADMHESWMAEKRREGWTYGLEKDPINKRHPAFVPYENLPMAQRTKDYLFQAVVRAMKD